MGYPAAPLAYCTGSWPTGPFATPAGVPAVVGDLTAVRAVAHLAAAVTAAREDRSWSRATLAYRAELTPHTVGRIEAGQTWPDLATIARLANALGLELALLPARPTAAGSSSNQPLVVDVAEVDEPTAAQVIEALLHNSARVAGEVKRLQSQRPRPHR